MKKINFLILLFTVLIISCDSTDQGFSSDPELGWVQLSDANCESIGYTSGSKILIPIRMFVPVVNEGITINYELIGNQDLINQFLDYDGFVFVYSDNYQNPNIEISVKEGVDITTGFEFRVKLTSTSSNARVGVLNQQGQQEKPIEKRIVAGFALASSYTAVSTALLATPVTADPWVPDFSNSVDGEVNTWELPTCWGTNFVPTLTGNPANSAFAYPGFFTVNPDYSVTIVGINSDAFPNRYQGGEGTYNPCTGVITYELRQGLFTNPFRVSVTLIPN